MRSYFFAPAAFALLAWCNSASAQASVPSVTLPTGAVFEILVDTTEQDRKTVWLLKKDNEFVQAERKPIFQFRFTQPGTYELAAQSVTSTREQNLQLHITVQAAPVDDTTSAGLQTPVRITEVYTTSTSKLLQIESNVDNMQQILMDANIEKDTNADNDPVNDNALRGTFFAKGSGKIFVWLPDVASKQTVVFGARLADNTIATQQFSVGTEAQAQPEVSPTEESATGSAVEPIDEAIVSGEITYETLQDGNIQFTVDVPDIENGAEPFVPLWKFGDGSQSMLHSPKHTYAAEGNYTVVLTLRSLKTGEVLAQKQSTVQITDIQNPLQPIPNTDTPVDQPKTEGGSLWKTIFIAFVLLVVSLSVGALVVFILSRLRNKDLHEHFAEVEEKHFTNTAEVPAEPMPMEIPHTEEDIVEAEITEEKTEAPEEPAKVPSWLTATAAAPAAPEFSDTNDKERVSQLHERVPQTRPDTVQKVENTAKKEAEISTPPWLQETAEAEASPKKTVGPKAEPKKPEPTTQETEATPEAIEKPNKSEVETPPWLQTKQAESIEANKAEEPTKTEPPKESIQKKQETATPPWLQENVKESATEKGADQPEEKPEETEATEKPKTATPPWLQPKQETKNETKTTKTSSETNSLDTSADEKKLEAKPVQAEPAVQETESATPTTEKTETVTPPWLQPKQETESEIKTAEAPSKTDALDTSTEKKPEIVTPPWLQESAMESPTKKNVAENPAETTEKPTPEKTKVDSSASQKSKEERERERKKRKRQRYRQNKKAREEQQVGQASTAPVTDTIAPEVPITPKEMDIPPADDNEVKFVISADSVDENQSDEKKL